MIERTLAQFEAYKSQQKVEVEQILASLCWDIGQDGARSEIDTSEEDDWLAHPEWYLDSIEDLTPLLANELSSLSWYPDHGEASLLYRTDSNNPPPDRLPFDYAWLHISFAEDEMRAIPRGTFRDVRDLLVRERVGEGFIHSYEEINDQFVLFVLVDGPGYTIPDIAAVGPAVRSKSDNGEATPDMVKTVFCDLNRSVSDHGFNEATLRQKLGNLLKLGNPDRWRETFSTSADTRKAIRERFARQLKDRIEALMNAVVETAGDTPAALSDADETTALKAAREAATLLVFRLMFLSEMESRHLLYQHTSPTNERILIEYAAEILQTSARTEGKSTGDIDMLKRLTHLTRAVRTQEDYSDPEVLLSGGSIFANRPNNQFTVYPAAWLNAVEDAVAQNTISGSLRHQWNDALARTTELVTGFIDDDVQLTKTRAGQGAAEHTHRIFGDVYEQLLRFTPEQDDDGSIRLVIDDEERNKVAAHYTPADLVEEVVRPTLGHLFEQHWNDCDQNAAAYEKRLMKLRIVDPAMGSAHFLTVAALELAREVAYVQMNGTPRPFDWHEPLEHDNPIGYDPGDEGYPGDADDTLAQPAYHGAGDAHSFNEKVADILPGLVQRNIYGVDIKPMAAELGKLALWLFTMSVQDHSDAPDASAAPSLAEDLVYLDANIKSGDSLVGMLRSDVHDTIENTLRASSSVVDTQNTLFATEKQVDSVADKMQRADTLLTALREGADVLSDDDQRALEDALGEPLNLDAQPNAYARKERLDHAVRAYLSDLRWVFDLTLAIHYIGYTSGSREGKAGLLYEALFNEHGTGKDTNELKEPIEEALGTLFDAPESDAARTYQDNLRSWITARPDLNPFHWELEYPDAFAHEGFDAVVANPPFIGDRDLRERLGSEDLVEFLANYFIPQQKKSDYSGFFFWRYHHITNQEGAVGSLASNSIAQASNRAYVTKPLTYGVNAPFTLFRAMPNDEWPSEANVHFSAGYMARKSDGSAVIIQDGKPKATAYDHAISSYFDEYPDYDLRQLLSRVPSLHQGFILRGNFSIHRQPGESLADAIEAVPEEERDALAAYLNADDVQNNPRPTPSDVVIDFFEPLREADLGDASASQQRAFLEANYPVLFDQLQDRSPHDTEQACIYEQRKALSSSGSNDEHKEKWWLFGSVRQGLRLSWKSSTVVRAIPSVIKVWSPASLGKEIDIEEKNIRICPMHNLYVSGAIGIESWAVSSSFLFEMVTRRQCSSLETRLRFTPTNVFPYFPWPWEPKVEDGTLTIGSPPAGMRASLETAAQNLLDLRTDILEHPEAHQLTRAQIGGPTDLYNIYDSNPNGDTAREGADNASVERLRQAHVDLLNAVLHAYGWSDLANQCTRTDWTFDRPWLDRTERFVPPEPIRAELFERIDTLNSERYKQECALMTDLIIDNLPPDGLTKTGFREKAPFSGMSIDADLFEELMIKEQATPNPRVKKKGHSWKRL